ncbi:MAG: hypothetical protein IJP68_10650 [Selenomonadaceae bacterium]|nr:hypothetical protein [Selenomonadaceae bacterium]
MIKNSQKGHGLLEYALMFGFVAAVFLVGVVLGGFDGAIGSLVGDSSDSMAKVNSKSGDSNSSSSSTASSFADATLNEEKTSAADETETPVYKTLNWQVIIEGVTKTRGTAQSMYAVIIDKDKKSNSPDTALVSEINLFGEIMTMTEGYLSSTKAEDGLKDWQTFMSSIERLQKDYNFKSSYKRGDETLKIERLGNSNAVQIVYSNKSSVTYYKLSPDANNVMQVESNSNKSYAEFFSTIKQEKGWEYST